MNHRLYILTVLVLLLATSGPVLATGELKVRYPAVQHAYFTKRDVYFISLLKMAMERSGEDYQLIPIEYSEYSEKRSMLLIQSNQYDVHWLNTNAELERELLPVRAPLYKGAIGWRVFFIRPEMQSVFSEVESAEDLKRYVFVQGHDWADVPILLNAGFAIERASNWQGLFRMVSLNRAQAFPRSIVEIVTEHKEDVAQDLAIEQSLILKYPAAYYFFVAQGNNRLQQALQRGLKKSMQDGSFDQWFFENFGQHIAKLDLQNRKIISVENPELEIENEDLWFSLEWFKGLEERFGKPLGNP